MLQQPGRHGGPDSAAVFATTHWSVVLSAGDETSPKSAEALEKLCASYWYPLYAFARMRGYPPHDAQDHTQEFFAHLLERNSLHRADPQKGRFRSFLLASFKHFLANEWDRAHAQKRGGHVAFISLDAQSAEARFALEPISDLTPETLYHQRWALTVLDRAFNALRIECAHNGKSALFEELKPFLSSEANAGDYTSAAAHLNMSPNAIGVAVHRLRQRYRELVRAEIAQTVTTPADLDSEMNHLFAALG
ncbi:MAG: sigma-70 family RNA polymerase sigma factor [Verrucomicrobiota bacterium]